MELLTDQLTGGRYIRIFTAVDPFSRDRVALHLGFSNRSKDFDELLDQAIERRQSAHHLDVNSV